MVSNSAKLDHRTKQHTKFGVSASNGSRDISRTRSWRKKKKKKKEKRKKNSRNPIKHPLRGSLIVIVIVIIIKIIIIIIIIIAIIIIIIIIITRQVLGRPVCDRRAIPRTLVQSNVVRSRLIILINEEINKANWMVSHSAKLDRRTKQHTQFGVSASNGSRDMARTKLWRKKRKKNNKITKRIGW